jgi:hypothetical protein
MKFLLLCLLLMLTACDYSTKKEIKAYVASQFKDPESTQFRKETFDKANGVMCGEVNSKNSYGAYAGFKRFIAKKTEYLGLSTFVEDIGSFYEGGLPLGKEELISLAINKHFTLVSINAMRKERGEAAKYSEEFSDKLFDQYSKPIKEYDELIRNKIIYDEGEAVSDGEVEAHSKSLGKTIAFIEAYKEHCNSQ